MPHSRIRYATPLLKQLLKHSPIVGILGQRQTGKTTLSEILSEEYSTLDLHSTLEIAEKNPILFLENRAKPFVIDECQLAPKLFPALKEKVRKQPAKGQFILTGSVRFTSRKAIRESLTGRIVNLELLPFSLAENYAEPLPNKITQWMKAKTFPQEIQVPMAWVKKIQNRLSQFLTTGGLPGICFFRESHVRAPRFETHLETLLERDIRLLINTTVSYRQLKLLGSLLALEQGEPLNFSEIGRKVGLSAPYVRKMIGTMESMFLIRTLSIENHTSPIVFFEDQGVASYLTGEQIDQQRDLTRGLFSCLLPQFLYRPELMTVFSQYRTRGGAKVDLVIRTREGIIGVVPVANEKATAAALASARSFLANFANAKIIIAHQGFEIVRVSDHILSIPYPLIISDSWS